MRISKHGDDLLITDQSLGMGAFLTTLGAFLLANAIGDLFAGPVQGQGAGLGWSTVAFALIGLVLLRIGIERLAARQLIIDPQERLITTRHWRIASTQVHRIPFDAVENFEIVPVGRTTSLMIATSQGRVPALGGSRAAREAWDQVIEAITVHMGRRADQGPVRAHS